MTAGVWIADIRRFYGQPCVRRETPRYFDVQMAATLRLPAAVREQPPSTRLVYLALLEGETPLTVATITAETGVSADRVRRVLGHLREESLVTVDDDPTDGRRNVYSLARDQVVSTSGLTPPADGETGPVDTLSTRSEPADPRGERR